MAILRTTVTLCFFAIAAIAALPQEATIVPETEVVSSPDPWDRPAVNAAGLAALSHAKNAEPKAGLADATTKDLVDGLLERRARANPAELKELIQAWSTKKDCKRGG